MKSFSPAGAAVKAFYGLGARTFGNPAGAHTGGGASGGGDNPNGPNQGGGGGGVVVPQFQLAAQAGGVFDALDQPSLLIIGGNTILGDTMQQSPNAAIPRSLNSGLTWTRHSVEPFLPVNTTSLSITATNGAGTFVGIAVDTSIPFSAVWHILTSTDNGATWTETTPSATVEGQVGYSAVFAQFILWDGTQSTNGSYWTSGDGLTWTQSAALAIPALSNSLTLDGAACTCCFGLQWQFGGPPQIWRTTNGTTWAPVFTPADALATWGGNSFACTDRAGTWFCLFFDNGTNTNRLYRSLNDGASWVEVSSAANADLPPFPATVALFRGALFSAASGTTSLGVAQSITGGVSFGPVVEVAAPNTFALGIGSRVASDGQTLYAWNNAIVSATAYPVFGTALAGGALASVEDLQCGPGYAVAAGTDAAGLGSIWRVS